MSHTFSTARNGSRKRKKEFTDDEQSAASSRKPTYRNDFILMVGRDRQLTNTATDDLLHR